MELSLPEFPSTPGAQMVFIATAIAILIGFGALAFPGTAGRLVGLQSGQYRPGGIGELRIAGGFLAGLALATLMFDQPVLYTALGIAFACAAFGRILSLLSDKAASPINLLVLLVQVSLAGVSLRYFFDVFTPDLNLAIPEDPEARLVFFAYCIIAALGALVLLAPGIWARISGLQAATNAGFSAIRSAGGFALGAALTAIVLANPMLDLGFGAALAFAVLGRLVGLALNRGNHVYAGLALLVQSAAAVVVVNHVTGMMA